MNTKYDIEEGNYIFKIYPENYESFIYIIAKKIKCNIINQNPFDFMENNKWNKIRITYSIYYVILSFPSEPF